MAAATEEGEAAIVVAAATEGAESALVVAVVPADTAASVEPTGAAEDGRGRGGGVAGQAVAAAQRAEPTMRPQTAAAALCSTKQVTSPASLLVGQLEAGATEAWQRYQAKREMRSELRKLRNEAGGLLQIMELGRPSREAPTPAGSPPSARPKRPGTAPMRPGTAPVGLRPRGAAEDTPPSEPMASFVQAQVNMPRIPLTLLAAAVPHDLPTRAPPTPEPRGNRNGATATNRPLTRPIPRPYSAAPQAPKAAT